MRRMIVAMLMVVLSAGLCFGETKVITAATDPWPPFMDPDSPTEGLSMEIVRAALGREGYEVKMHFMPWARAEEGVREGTYDILPNTWMTDSRKEVLLYSEPYAANELKLVKRKGDPFEYEGMESLKGLTVGVIRDYGYGDAFMSDPAFKRDPVPDFVTNVKKLVAGRVDLTLEDEIVGRNLLATAAPELLDQIEFTKNPMSVQNLHVTSGLKNPKAREIIEAFDRGLAAIRADGTFDEILSRYGIK